MVLKLQPNSTAINFKEFFTKSKNLFKTTPWKQISRRVIEEDKRRRIKSSVGRATSAGPAKMPIAFDLGVNLTFVKHPKLAFVLNFL